MTAYYNEIDPYAAQWLRNLIAAGHIAPGVVDERDIRDVCPNDLREFTQCHFFAGVGVWSYALRLAQWPDSRPVWTGSCPCQPFSVAGVGTGFGDERHLWPFFHALIEQCRPPVILGEQVASKDADPWIDLVQTDMEAVGYAVGAVPFPSAGVGAPHIRDRLYWVADATDQRQHGRRASSPSNGLDAARFQLERLRHAGRVDHTDHAGLEGFGSGYKAEVEWWRTFRSVTEAGEFGRVGDASRKRCGETGQPGSRSAQRLADASAMPCGLADSEGNGWREQRPDALRSDERGGTQELEQRLGRSGILGSDGSAGPTNGIWADADWLFCRDGKWRPVEPGTFPLAHGATNRVGRLRAYGNAINAEAARVFIECVMECMP